MPRPVQATDFNFTHRSLPVKVDNEGRANKRYLFLSLVAVAIFVFFGALTLPLLGLQSDEVMFICDLWHPGEALSSFSLFHHFFMPFMMTPYLGALKSWLFTPWLKVAPLSVWTIRIPALTLAVITILLTGRLLRKVQGRTAAAVGVGLLATDATFLVTSVFDWGSVAIQNLLLVAGMLLLLKWYRGRRDAVLFLAGLVFGLALWNKALFVWNLSGLAIALLLVALPELIRAWRWKAAGVLVVGLCIGASPLILFNLRQQGATFKGSHPTLADIGSKAAYLRRALNGRESTSALIDPTLKGVDHVHRAFQQVALAAAGNIGGAPSLWRVEAGIVLIVAGLFAADKLNRKWIFFFVVSGLIGWFASAITVNAGGLIDHTIPFWINWYCAVALGAAAIPRFQPRVLKPIVGALILLLCLRGLFLLDLEYAQLISYDARTPWTNADENLTARLMQSGVIRAITADSGIARVVNVRSHDAISSDEESIDAISRNFDRHASEECQTPDCVVISHVPERIVRPRAGPMLEDSLHASSTLKVQEETIADTHGFPIYSVFHVRDEASKGPATSGRFMANPAVIISANGLGQTTLTWRVPAAMYVEIHTDRPDGPVFASSTGSGSAKTGLWVKNGTQFFLQNRADNKPLTLANTIAKIQMEVRAH